MQARRLRRGDIIVATIDLDKAGANVRRGTVGVVFEELNAYGDGAGPMVRWMNMGACNVYDGQVDLLRGQAPLDEDHPRPPMPEGVAVNDISRAIWDTLNSIQSRGGQLVSRRKNWVVRIRNWEDLLELLTMEALRVWSDGVEDALPDFGADIEPLLRAHLVLRQLPGGLPEEYRRAGE